ncbi:MAG: ATP-dependent DNA helicase RecG, partial [Archangium sp.]
MKDLRSLLERALAGATGVDAEALEQLRAALPHVDHPAQERRKAALRRVLAGLKLSGVPLPEELAQVASAPPTTPLPPGEGRGEGTEGPGLNPSEGRPELVPAWKSTAPVPPPPGTRSAPPRAVPVMAKPPPATPP